jgi:hypothetical protein
VINPELLAALYELGAEIVLTATDARKLQYTMTFAGQRESLALTLPPGHYIFCRVPEPPGKAPGLASIANPSEKRQGNEPE